MNGPAPGLALPGAAAGDPALGVGGRRRLDNFQHVSDLGAGNFGVAKLMLDRSTNQLVAIKFIERGGKIDRNVEREIMNHSTLNHPNIVSFREVFLTPTHLAIVMEFAAGGELFDRIVRAGRFSEDEARYFFQQLVSGVDYCHQLGVCHRDLKLENTLLDNNPAPRLKICDFGYSKSAMDSQPKSTVGTPAYIAPEVLQRKEYSGQTADVWSCGVTLYVMLVGAYPFEDPGDPRNFRKTIQRIMAVQYQVPPDLPISADCKDLVARIFVAAPQQRITMAQIKQHPWFLKNLPIELSDPSRCMRHPEPVQSQDQIRGLIHAARELEPVRGRLGGASAEGGFGDDDLGGGHASSMADELNDHDLAPPAAAGLGPGSAAAAAARQHHHPGMGMAGGAPQHVMQQRQHVAGPQQQHYQQVYQHGAPQQQQQHHHHHHHHQDASQQVQGMQPVHLQQQLQQQQPPPYAQVQPPQQLDPGVVMFPR